MSDETTSGVANAQPEPQSQAPGLDQLKAELRGAIDAGNDAEVMRLSKLVLKNKTDVEKSEALKLKAEAEAMAGERESLGKAIYKAVRGVIDPAQLLQLKAKGFTFTIDHNEDEKGKIDPAGSVIVKGGVALIVPAIRKAGGGGGGSTGQLKQQTGLSRHEIIDQFATDAEKAIIAEAEAGATSRPDSARYSAEKPIVKRILDEHRELIKR